MSKNTTKLLISICFYLSVIAVVYILCNTESPKPIYNDVPSGSVLEMPSFNNYIIGTDSTIVIVCKYGGEVKQVIKRNQ